MAVDKLVDSTQLNADLTSVANAIRTKGGTSGQLSFPAGFVQAIGDISGGGGGGNANVSQDANGYIVLDDDAPSGGGGKTLLADYTASEDVSEIVLSGDFSGYPFYYLILYGSFSRAEWIYPTFNDVSNTSYYWGGQSGVSSFDTQIPICTPITGTPSIPAAANRLFMNANGANNAINFTPNLGGPFTKLSLKLYYPQSLFLSGFNVKLWGVSA